MRASLREDAIIYNFLIAHASLVLVTTRTPVLVLVLICGQLGEYDAVKLH